MNHKRTKRRVGGIKGCCGLCMLAKRTDCHHRIPTRQERRVETTEEEARNEYWDNVT